MYMYVFKINRKFCIDDSTELEFIDGIKRAIEIAFKLHLNKIAQWWLYLRLDGLLWNESISKTDMVNICIFELKIPNLNGFVDQ